MNYSQEQADTYALISATAFLFPDLCREKFSYGMHRFGLSGMLHLSRAAHALPEKDLSDIIRSFQQDAECTPLNNFCGISFVKEVLDSKDIKLPSSAFSLLTASEQEAINLEEAYHKIPENYVSALLSRVKNQTIPPRSKSLIPHQKRLTYQKPTTIDETVDRLRLISGCSQQEAQEFYSYTRDTAIDVCRVLLEEGVTIPAYLSELREFKQQAIAKEEKRRRDDFYGQAIQFLYDQGVSEADAKELFQKYKEHTISVFNVAKSTGHTHQEVLSDDVLAQLPVDDIEQYMYDMQKSMGVKNR